ncbi:glycosyltransferase family 4 protein [Sphingomonas profundi]|uniref:glycosyltransferase family 4 protein n=1 Tax=Alterirhizorhabdus profundi TaxID=2681549 RepID=UPI0012E79F6B|nr:glycosyltransferase family 4 protein [Sphingomonas profundi]
MRILHLHKDFEPLRGGGGTARHIHGLAKALVADGHAVRVIAPDAEATGASYESVVATATGFAPHVAWADVVHVHGARSKYAVAGAIRAKLAGKPFFYTPHAFYEPHGPANAAFKAVWDRTAEKFLLEKGAQTILLTDYWRGWLKARGISDARTTIIPNCIMEADLIVPPRGADVQRLAGRPALLTVGRLDPVKRVGDIIKALARPGLAQAQLHVVGKGPQREELEALAGSLGVTDRVTFHGFVDDAGVAAMVAGADAFVLASEQEGLPTVLLEALIAHLPVVCTRIPGNLAITSVGGVETTYPVGDIDALAALLARVADERIGDEQVAALKRHFTWEHRARDIAALYTAALGTPKR